MKKAFIHIIYFLTIAGIICFLISKRDELQKLTSISFAEISLLILLNLILLLLTSYAFKVIISCFKIQTTFKYWFGINAATTMYNYLLPMKGGLVLRGIYLKKYFHLEYSRYLSLTSINYLILLVISSLTGIIIGFSLYTNGSVQKELLLATVVIFGSILVFVLCVTESSIKEKPAPKHLIHTMMLQIILGIKQLGQHKHKLYTMIGIQALFLLLSSIKLQYVFYTMGEAVHLHNVIFVQAVVMFSRVLAITPGNIGIQEGIVGLSADVMGVPTEQALLVAIIDRILLVLVVFVSGTLVNRKLLLDAKSSFST